MLPPFRVSFVEVQRRGLKYARELVRAAVVVVEARDLEIARLRTHIANMEISRRGPTYSIDNPASSPLGLWTMHGDRPQRLCTLAPGDRLMVLRAEEPAALDEPKTGREMASHG